MSYLLCYAGFRPGTIAECEKMRTQFAPAVPIPTMPPIPSSVGPDFIRTVPDVNIEEFETFKDAVSQYTYRCLFCSQVTLSKICDITGEGEIIRQYSYSRDVNNSIFIG